MSYGYDGARPPTRPLPQSPLSRIGQPPSTEPRKGAASRKRTAAQEGATFIDLYAEGAEYFIKHPGFTLTADGNAAFSGALSAASGTFSGALDGATGTFAGALSAATGTFAGALSAATGTFSGNLDAASGTFSQLTTTTDGSAPVPFILKNGDVSHGFTIAAGDATIYSSVHLRTLPGGLLIRGFSGSTEGVVLEAYGEIPSTADNAHQSAFTFVGYKPDGLPLGRQSLSGNENIMSINRGTNDVAFVLKAEGTIICHADGTSDSSSYGVDSVVGGDFSVTGAVTLTGEVTLGAAASLHRSVDTSLMQIRGGGTINEGSGILLFGGAHATLPNQIFTDANTHTWRNQTGAVTLMTLSSAGHVGIGGASSSSASLLTKAATTALSSLRVPHGAAPSAPVNGDIWTTTAGLFVRVNGATVGPLS